MLDLNSLLRSFEMLHRVIIASLDPRVEPSDPKTKLSSSFTHRVCTRELSFS